MPCITFNKRFVPLIIRGTKVHTVRCVGGRSHRAGETLYMQYGPRFRPLRFATLSCNRVRPIDIGHDYVRVWDEERTKCIFPDLNLFSQADGFASWSDLRRFFDVVPRLDMQLIQWAPAPWESEAACA